MCLSATIIGAIGLGVSAAGTVAGFVGQQQATEAAKKAEAMRANQMGLESARQRREIARRATVARATALSNATNQGAGQGSGLQGGFGQIAGQAGNATLAVNQNQELGQAIFGFNRQQYNGNSLASFGQGLQGLGGSLTQNQELFGRVGSYLFNQPFNI